MSLVTTDMSLVTTDITTSRTEESGKSTNENLAELLSDISTERGEESVFSLKRLLDVGNNKNVLRQNYVDETVLKFTMRRIENDKDMVAADLCRGQNVFKKKLKIYRDKQRKLNEKRFSDERKHHELKNSKSESTESLEELLKNQLLVRRPTIKKKRPATCIPTLLQLKTKTDHLKDTGSVEFDKKFFINRKRYRVDLRPSVSNAFRDRPDMLDKAMKMNRGYLADPKEAVRYFEDDEVDERKGIYNILTEIRKKVEAKKLKKGQQKMNMYLDQYFPRKMKSVILSDGQETDLGSIQDQAQSITISKRAQPVS